MGDTTTKVRDDADEDRLVRLMRSAAMLAIQERGTDIRTLQLSHDLLANEVAGMKLEMQEQGAATKRVEENTAELVDAFKAMKGGFKVLGWIGGVGQKLAWLGVAAAAGYAVWQAFVAWVKSGAPRP